MSDKTVNYEELISHTAEEDWSQRNVEIDLPQSVGEQIVDYLAVSKAWKEERGWMDSGKKN